jgi:hypothetical protein
LGGTIGPAQFFLRDISPCADRTGARLGFIRGDFDDRSSALLNLLAVSPGQLSA